MGGLYLETGESIVLTADRVSIDGISFDAILTTRRLILMDSRHARSEPRTIHLAAIESVRSGKAATGEPVIIIAYQKQDGNVPENTIIVFSQEPLENRKQDRDLWMQKFIELSISGREGSVHTAVPPARKPEGMNPSTRRWVAPEIIRPHHERSQMTDASQKVEIIPDDLLEPQIFTVKPAPSPMAPKPGPDIPEEGDGDLNFLASTQTTDTPITTNEAPGSQGRLERESEEPGQSTVSTVPEVPITPETLSDIPSPLSYSILAAVRSMTISREAREPENSVRATPPSPVSLEEKLSQEEVPASIRNTSPLPEIVTHSPPSEDSEGSLLQQDTKETDPTDTVVPELGCHEKICDSHKDETRQSHVPDIVHADDSPAEAMPDFRIPTPVSGRNGFFIAGGVILCLMLVIAGAVLLPVIFPQHNVSETPAPETIPLQTPEPTQSPTTLTIPPDGIWVRIKSPGYFIGQAGNPGALQSISGSGEKVIKVHDSADLVQVFAEKQEYTGAILLVEIYKNGTIISSHSVTAPRGSVDVLIDPGTGKPPGIAVTTYPANTTSNVILQNL
jgi:hypothetical protein